MESNGYLKTLDCKWVALVGLMMTTGCAGLVANVMHVGWGNKVPAAFGGLEEKKVAVVSVSSSSSYGPVRVSNLIAKQVSSHLRKNVRRIEVIEQQEIERWKDEHNWNEIDYVEIGQGVGADYVVAVDLLSFRLYEGKTLYKGRSQVSVSVYDTAQVDDDPVFQSELPEIQFPVNAGQHTTDISESDFRRRFVSVVSQRIARHFYPYDFKDDFAQDRTLVAH